MAASRESYKVMRTARDSVKTELLCSNIALLPGSTSRQGNPVIHFPDQQGSSSALDWEATDISALLNYYVAIDRWRNDDPKSFCIVVDARDMVGTVRNTIANSLNVLVSTTDGVVGDVAWVVDDVATAESAVFPVVAGSTGKSLALAMRSKELDGLIPRHQQPLDLGGGFLFDPSKWLHYRMHVEKILHQCDDCLNKAEVQLLALQSLAIDVNIHDVDSNRRRAALLVSTLTLRLPPVLNTAARLLSELLTDGRDALEVNMASTLHYSSAIGGTRDIMAQLAEAQRQLQAAAGLEDHNDEELAVEGCDRDDCPLGKIQTHGITSFYTTMRIGESLGETQQLLNDFNLYSDQCKSYIDHSHCASSSAGSSDTSPCSLVISCFSAALQHRSDHLNVTMAIHVMAQGLVNWAILALNILASQSSRRAAEPNSVERQLNGIDEFLADSPPPGSCEDELNKLYARLNQPCVLLLHCHAVCRMVDVAKRHITARRQYLRERLESMDSADGGHALEDEYALVGLSDDDDDDDDDDCDDDNNEDVAMDESGNGDSGAAGEGELLREEAKFDHGNSFTPPRKVRASEEVVEERCDDVGDDDVGGESMFSTWLQRVRHVSDTVAAVAAALLPQIPVARDQLPRQLSTCVDEYQPLQTSWLIDLQDADEAALFRDTEHVDAADAAAYQAMMKQRQELITELIEQEERYIEDLERIVKEYVVPFSRDSSRPTSLIGKKGAVFGNIEKILEFNQTQFYPALKQIRKAPIKLGACFLEYERQFSTYSLYFRNMPSQEQFLQTNKEYFKLVQMERLQDPNPIETYLLQPLSRMGKYRQCLQDMVKTTGDSERMQASREELESAIKLVRFHLRHGNDLIAQAQIRGYPGNIAEEGLLLRQDEFVVTDGWGNHKRRVFLFEDLIMFTKTQTVKKVETVYQYKSSFKVSDFGLKQTVSGNAKKFELTFRKGKPIVFLGDSVEKREEWVAELHNILLQQFERLKERMKEVQIGNEINSVMSRPNFEPGTLTRGGRGGSFMSGGSSGVGVGISGPSSRYSASSAQSGTSGSTAAKHYHTSMITGPVRSSPRSSILSDPRSSILSDPRSSVHSVHSTSSSAGGDSAAGGKAPSALATPAMTASGSRASDMTVSSSTGTSADATAGFVGEDGVAASSSFQAPPRRLNTVEESPDKAESYNSAEEKNVQRETSL